MQQLEINNFRRFSSITVPLNKDFLVIAGESGSGKSQILYAILIFLKCYNHNYYQLTKYKGTNVEKLTFNLTLSLESHKLLHPSFSFPTNLCENIHDKDVLDGCAVLNAFGTTLKLKPDGIYHLTSNEHIKGLCKYAFMGHTFYFSDEYENVICPLTSINSHIRSCSKKLLENKVLWSKFVDNITTLFPSVINVSISCHIDRFKLDENIDYEDTNIKYVILIAEKFDKKVDSSHIFNCERKTEIKNMGSAFQKVFATLVLMYNLIIPCKLFDTDKYENVIDRYFIIEEPECLLSPSLTVNFYNMIKKICSENNIKLIMVSNSMYIISSTYDVFYLHN